MKPIRDTGCYCLSFETIDTVDIFVKPMYKQIIVHSLNHFIDNKGLVVYGWCLTSNQLAIMCQAQTNLSIIMLRDEFKSFTCEKLTEALKEDGDIKREWILGHFEKSSNTDSTGKRFCCWNDVLTTAEINMNDPESVADYLNIIHSSPVKDRIVQYQADYLYSSARAYIGMPGLVKITKSIQVEQQLHEIENRKDGFKPVYRNTQFGKS